MKKFVLLILMIMLSSMFQSANAEKIPVKITPTQIVSTNHDEINIGDWVGFEIVNDVYLDDKLYIKKGTPIYGFVDFVHPNGWGGDCAEIKFKTFKTIDAEGKKITLNSFLDLQGKCSKGNDLKQSTAFLITGIVRGSEIYFEPDTKTFNIFLTQ